MARSDLADSCWIGCEGNRTLPSKIIYTDNDGLRADYECSACGAEWWTSWGATGAGWPTLIAVAVDPGRPTLADLEVYDDAAGAA